MKPVIRSAAALALTFASCGVLAQSYPVKPIKVVVAVAPGPGVDYVARAIAQIGRAHV